MHAYLIVGTQNPACAGKSKIKTQIEELSKKLKAETMEFPIEKIDDVRSLNSFVKLSMQKSTAIIIKNIENATLEASNAFLKNLEEPQKNIYYILTSASVYKVLPTIISRCQVIKIRNSKFEILNDDAKKNLEMTTAEKLAFLDKIKSREDATYFVNELIYFLHDSIINNGGKYSKLSQNISWVSLTLERLKANGNVNLQLTNMAINLN